ncbi:hypothetical protein GOODEAATRI_008410 [Goodea atripinnis]|uniref:Uncharacterized protein n=1 Tax=Goodea atripinnis TaxID=208336 RepID=A0ABV0MG72_9TELE
MRAYDELFQASGSNYLLEVDISLSLPFRTSYSSSALSLSDRCLLQPEPEGRNHSARAEIKEQADARLARGATPKLLQARVGFLSSTVLSSQHSQEINGRQKSRTLLRSP